jgi:Ala-tRNA(Pro) deacylase
MTCLERLTDYLSENGVDFEHMTHPEAFTAQEVAAVQHIPGDSLAKVVMAFAGGEMVMLVLPATSKINFAKVRSALGVEEVRLAQEKDFAGVFPDCEVGAMPPFGNLYAVPVYVDRLLANSDEIVFDAGTHTDALKLRYADWERLVKPTTFDFALHE